MTIVFFPAHLEPLFDRSYHCRTSSCRTSHLRLRWYPRIHREIWTTTRPIQPLPFSSIVVGSTQAICLAKPRERNIPALVESAMRNVREKLSGIIQLPRLPLTHHRLLSLQRDLLPELSPAASGAQAYEELPPANALLGSIKIGRH